MGSSQPHPFHLDNRELERELQWLGEEVKALRDRAETLQSTTREDLPISLFPFLPSSEDSRLPFSGNNAKID